MRFVDDDDRIAAACPECGAVYVAVKRQDGEITPIGSEAVCRGCGGTEFEPIDEVEAPEADDDDD